MADLIRLAPDTNLLAYRTPRQFLHGISLANNIELVVLPEVLAETKRRLRAAMQPRLIKALRANESLDDKARERILLAAGDAVEHWFVNEISRSDNAYSPTKASETDALDALEIAATLPSGILRQTHREASGDPLIIAQAVVHNVHLLSTNNLKTIDHEKANEWASQFTQGMGGQLIHTPDETINALARGDRERVARWVISYAGARPDKRADGRWQDTFETAIDSIRRAGFRNTAEKMSWLHTTTPDYPAFDNVIRVAMEESQRTFTLALNSERRRADRVREAMVEQGWVPATSSDSTHQPSRSPNS